MATHLVSSTPILAETLDPSFSDSPVTANPAVPPSPWMFSSLGLGGILIVVGLWCKLQCQKKQQALESAIARNQALQQQLDLAIEGCQRWESLPDLLYARRIGLDYIRMRMDEEVFHYIVINQIQNKVTNLISASLRPTLGGKVSNSNLQVDETFEIIYDIEGVEEQWHSGVLFRFQLKLSKLPIQSSSATVKQIVECIEVFLAHSIQQHRWHPSIQGSLVNLSWDENSKPIPLLCLEQSEDQPEASKPRSTRTRLSVGDRTPV
ncbi:MAG: hypothetical protein KA717_40010 [Woronichinia naegeliana WA131]|jgi:hypothetical protein|uniref:Uncharacterized protein n=1 Tax=Woronichinia naegeliana WA131 TaxID=2824559 RepID=A0A977KZD5_9CYAN|nr:MAG: hypothetical protein KA717_40010 [Woronichinia naegeliana WA131]